MRSQLHYIHRAREPDWIGNQQENSEISADHRLNNVLSLIANSMKIITIHITKSKLISLLVFLLFSTHLFAQQGEQAFLEAASEKGAQEFFYKNSRASYGGYLYVAGASINDDGNYDMLLTKYNGGTEVWSVNWNGSANGDDYAAGIAIDGSGNIILCGTTEVTSLNYNAVVAKYNSSGTLQWATTYAGSAGLADGFASVVVDNSNNIYTCGGTQTTTELVNYLTVKYNTSGTQQWASTYDYADLYDAAVKLVVSGTTVRTSGGTQINADDWQMTTVSYNTSTGAQGSVQHTGGDDEGVDKVTDVWTDGTYTYVVGAVRNTTTGYDWKVFKMNSDLVVQWSATYNGNANQDDEAQSVKVDGSGNVYVTGWTTVTGEGRNFVTRKYNSTGTVQWTSSFNEPSSTGSGQGERDDEAQTLELDASGNVLVSGSSYKDGNKDYYTIKYKYTDGSVVWQTRFNSDHNDNDIPSNIALDESGNIYLIGTVGKGNGTNTYMMCKYSVKTIYSLVPTDGYSSSGGYVTNKGQLRNDDGTSNTSVKFYNANHRIATYVENRYISYQLVHGSDTTNSDTTFRVQMEFTKGNTNPKVYPFKTRSEYHNYYLGHMAKASERTEIVNAAVRLDSYTNTDIIFTHSPSGFRHWIVARTGAPTSDFEMTFAGQTGLSVYGNGNLIVATSIGDITFTKTKAYSMNNGTGALTLLGWQPSYSISGSAVSFTSFGSWSGTLVLEFGEELESSSSGQAEQNVEWSTFFGGNADDEFKDISVDNQSNAFVVGNATSNNIENIGQTIGYAVSHDAIVVKFNEACEAVWMAYYGGSDEDYGESLIYFDDEIHVVGITRSDDLGVFSDSGLNDETLGGDTDGIYFRLDVNGFTTADSYIGGDDDDYCKTVAFGGSANGPERVYIGGFTNKGDGWTIMTTNGDSWDQAYNPGFGFLDWEDGFILCLNNTDPDQPMLWNTYLGSGGEDYVFDISAGATTMYVTGITSADDYSADENAMPEDDGFPNYFESGDFHPAFDNISFYEYFVCQFDVDDITGEHQMHYSTKLTEALSGGLINARPFISQKFNGTNITSVYVSGVTPTYYESAPEFPFEGTGWQQTVQEEGDQQAFIIRLDKNITAHSLGWSTLYGSGEDESAAGIAVDNQNQLYFTGQHHATDVQEEAEYCDAPNNSELPMCNANGLLYIEDDIDASLGRTMISVWTNEAAQLWATQYGDGDDNEGRAVGVNNDYVWIVGRAKGSWTLVDYDDGSIEDYYRISSGNTWDGAIARFSKEMIVGVTEQSGVQIPALLIYPNPSYNLINVEVPGKIGYTEIQFFDVLGQLVFQLPIYNGKATVDINHWANGVYTARCNIGDSFINGKFVIR